ncbi:MAG: EAL domain-containing protein [Pararhodobacter sp.]
MRLAKAATKLKAHAPAIGHPAFLAPVPVLTLAGLWQGSLWAILAITALQALWIGLFLALRSRSAPASPSHAPLSRRETLERLLASYPQPGEGEGLRGAALAVRLDDEHQLIKRHGGRYVDALVHALGLRLGGALREKDTFCRLPGGFGIALCPQRHMELEAVMAVAQRIQSHLGQSFSFEGVSIWPSVSIGFCLSPRAARLNGMGMLEAAEQAAEQALQAGPRGLYSYSAVDFPAQLSGEELAELRQALESGAICAHFQPQIDARTGKVSGLEALARWNHPQSGLLPPAAFLPKIESIGLSSKLAERMLRNALGLLRDLDAQGLDVPRVAINLAAPELRNPHLAEEIAWELDNHDLPPERLTIEILETVVADSDDDVVVRNIAKLAAMGCGIDLDDFGTGHASIANIRRFAVNRLKIDRSFISHIHEDGERQRMISAILSMAEQLELGTLAEGVETPQERAALAELGCQHLQGFAIARPMPPAEIAPWLRQVSQPDAPLQADRTSG